MRYLKLWLTLVLVLTLTGCWETPKCEKVGQVVEIYQSGLLYKTWEGIIKVVGKKDEKFNFTIPNTELLEKLQKHMQKKAKVKITYHKEGFAPLKSGSCNKVETKGKHSVTNCYYFVDGVEEVK